MPACHDPETPAPQFAHLYSNLSVPRIPSWNFHSSGNATKHWLIDWDYHPLSKDTIDFIDEKYRNRLRTLASVDDFAQRLLRTLQKFDQLDNTYLLFFSDNGYHLGHFNMVFDKRQPYEFDIHVPMFVSGPGIAAGTALKDIALNIDLAPTILDLAGVQIPPSMDGKSLKPILIKNNKIELTKTKKIETANAGQRTDFLVEYVGEYSARCHGMWDGCCFNGSGNLVKEPWCIDSINNTYVCLRTIHSGDNSLYCIFSKDISKDAIYFREFYDLEKDPFQLNNIALTVDPKVLDRYQKRIAYLRTCVGAQCQQNSFSGKVNLQL